ncbi:MAG: class I SAM-dependent RNA methyltransferase [Neomegalonema sp.]|nr:class I SAM-dependent RNA methyltransferase [Neomegalonema sp.]
MTALLEELSARFGAIAPPCPHAGTCGGCAFQQISLSDLGEWKRDRIAGALRGQGIDADIADVEISPPRSRRRARFSAMRTKKSVLLGFREAGAHTLAPIQECLLLRPELMDARPKLEELARLAAPRSRPIGIWATAYEDGLDVAVEEGKALDLELREAAAQWAEAADVARLSWNGELVAGRRPARLRIGPAMVEPPSAAFLQATAEGEAALARIVTEGVGGATRVADLFAGVGTFALRIAQTAEVLAVEGEKALTAAMDRAARNAHGVRRVAAVTRDLFRRPLRAEELAGVDAVVLDPPRAGAEAQMREIARTVPKFAADRVISLSCDAASFARDAKILMDGGWRMGVVRPVDQFLWSPHVEIAAMFRR